MQASGSIWEEPLEVSGVLDKAIYSQLVIALGKKLVWRKGEGNSLIRGDGRIFSGVH